jgi:hypothetical protein
LVFQVHYLKVGENFKHLLIKILSYSVHKKNGSRVGVTISSLSHLSELIEYQINGLANLL